MYTTPFIMGGPCAFFPHHVVTSAVDMSMGIIVLLLDKIFYGHSKSWETIGWNNIRAMVYQW